jgi:hypothetical protein
LELNEQTAATVVTVSLAATAYLLSAASRSQQKVFARGRCAANAVAVWAEGAHDLLGDAVDLAELLEVIERRYVGQVLLASFVEQRISGDRLLKQRVLVDYILATKQLRDGGLSREEAIIQEQFLNAFLKFLQTVS